PYFYLHPTPYLRSLHSFPTRRSSDLDRTVRFHAFQGLYLFVAWLIVEWVLSPIFREFHYPIFRVDKLLHILILGVWIFMIIKTRDRKSTRLNSSHRTISYAVFCLKKK